MFLSSKLLSRGMFNPCRNKIIPLFQLLVPKNQWTVNTSYQPSLSIAKPPMFSTINPKKDNSNMSDELSNLDFNATPGFVVDPVVSPLLSIAGSRQGLWTRKPYYYYDFMIMNSFAYDTLAIYITHILKSSG